LHKKQWASKITILDFIQYRVDYRKRLAVLCPNGLANNLIQFLKAYPPFCVNFSNHIEVGLEFVSVINQVLFVYFYQALGV